MSENFACISLRNFSWLFHRIPSESPETFVLLKHVQYCYSLISLELPKTN